MARLLVYEIDSKLQDKWEATESLGVYQARLDANAQDEALEAAEEAEQDETGDSGRGIGIQQVHDESTL